MKAAKFATQVDAKVLLELRRVSKETGQSISKLVTEALDAYLQRIRIRPAFRSAAEAVLKDNDELLRRLAK